MYAISVLRELEALTALEPAVELVGTLSDQTETRHGIFLKGSGSPRRVSCAFSPSYTSAQFLCPIT